MGLEVRQLKVLIAIADSGSLTAAATKVGLSQPAITRMIQRMEKDVGAPILSRGSTGARLTEQGQKLLAFAQRTVAAYDTLVAELAAPAAGMTGKLRIISSTTPGEYLVPELISSFNRVHPHVTVEVFVTDSGAVLEELLDRRWDLGFVGRRVENRALAYRPVAWDEIVLAVPARHRFARTGVVSMEALADQTFIEREDGSGTRLSVLDAFKRLGREVPPWRVAMVLGSTQAVVSAVDSALGIGFVTARALERYPQNRVTAVRIAETPLTRLLYLVRRRGGQPSPLVAAFERHVNGALPEVGPETRQRA